MRYPYRPYGYDPAYCPVAGLVPIRRRKTRLDDTCHGKNGDCHHGDQQEQGADYHRPPGCMTEGKNGVPSAPDFYQGDRLSSLLARIHQYTEIDELLNVPANQRTAVIERLVDHIVLHQRGWRANSALRAFLHWWHHGGQSDPQSSLVTDRARVDVDAERERIGQQRFSDALTLLFALIRGQYGFVHGYIEDLCPRQIGKSGRKVAMMRASLAALGALILSPIVLFFVVHVFLQIDTMVSGASGKLFGFSYDMLFFVGAFGAIGALVSMMLRLGKAGDLAGMASGSIFLNFLFRPCLGFCFSLIVLLALRAGILPIPLDQLHAISDMDQIGTIPGAGQQISVVLVLAFLSGFSERLGNSLISRVENRLGSDGS